MTLSITTTQVFSRRGLSYLWDNRSSLGTNEVSILDCLYKNRKKGTIECQQTVTYKLSIKKGGKLGWGRLYGNKGSLETLEKECRGTLCEEYYHDLDIVNCHFVLLAQFAKRKFNKDLPEVERYVENRESFLKQLGDNIDIAKTEVITVLYGGITRNEYLIPLSNETRKFSKFLSCQPEYEELFQSCKNETNVYGSFLSFVLQTEERNCMFAMKESLEKIGWSVDVLAYDGVMIRKNDKLDLNASIRACELAVKEKTNYQITIINKPMMSFKIPQLRDEISKGVSREMYNEMKSSFEENNFYYAPSNEMIQVRGRELMRMGLDHAREYYSTTWRFKHSDKFEDYTTFFDMWRKDSTRRTIQRIDMRESDDPTVFVMPPVFAWVNEGEYSLTAVDTFKEIMSLIGNPEQQEYIIKWLAQMIQQPFDRPGTSLVITGDKRTGKDTPFDFFREFVIGKDYSRNYTCGGSQFFDKHDTGRMNMFLCKVEEANRKVFLANADKFKSLITADDEMYNYKGKNAIAVANYNRFVLTTNGACPVEMSDGEQRFVVATCSSARKHDTEYWSKIRTVLFNKEAGRAVGEWLSAIDISGFNFRKVPHDEFQNDIIEAEASSEKLFIDSWDGQELSMKDFYEEYKGYCITNSLPYCLNSKSLGINLLKHLRNGSIRKRKDNSGAYFRK